MAPLFKVTIEATIDETFYVRAETDDFARDIGIEHVLNDTLSYMLLSDEVEVKSIATEVVINPVTSPPVLALPDTVKTLFPIDSVPFTRKSWQPILPPGV